MLESMIVFIIILNFLLSLNLFADFFKCCLFNNIPENLQKIFVNNEKPNNEKIETQPVPKQIISLL